MKYFPSLLVMWIGTMACYAHAADAPATQWGQAFALPSMLLSSDSEGFTARKTGVALYPYYEHGDHYGGLLVTQNHFSQNGWERDAMQYSLVSREMSPRTGMGYNANIGINSQNGRMLLTTDSSWDHRWNSAMATELFINRDWVETQRALDNHISHTFAGGSLEQKLTDRVTLVGVLGGQHFTDGNFREHGRARLIYDLLPEQGITAQLRYRIFHSEESDVSGNYFNPSRYQEAMFALGMRRRIAGWVVGTTLGIGRQRVESDPDTTTKLAEVSATSPIAGNVFLRLNAGYNQSSGFNGPNYTYRYVMGSLVFQVPDLFK